MPIRSLSPWTGLRGSNIFNQFDDFFGDIDRGFFPSTESPRFDFAPPMDLEEDESTYMLSIDLPGMKKSDIKIDFADNVLTISGERVRESKGEGKYTEKVYGSFQRSFTVPSHVEADKIKAQFVDGVLQVTLPKAEESKRHPIRIS